MRIQSTRVGTTAYFINRSWKGGSVLLFRKEDVDCARARVKEKTMNNLYYDAHSDKIGRHQLTGTMLTCISKPYVTDGPSVWVITDSKSKHFGKLIILNGQWYNMHIDPHRGRVGFPTPTHYDLVENSPKERND